MEYWMCYHKANEHGLPDGGHLKWNGDRFLDELDTEGCKAGVCDTKKPVLDLRKGHKVLMIVGAFSPRRFYLWSSGDVTKIRRKPGETRIEFSGNVLNPPVELSGSAFNEFKQRRVMFRGGFSRITDDPYLTDLKKMIEEDNLAGFIRHCGGYDKAMEVFETLLADDDTASIDDVHEQAEADGDLDESDSDREARERVLRSIVLRRGQQEFRSHLLKAYKKRCAVTGCDVVELLEAAHIKPVAGSGNNLTRNGLLLRADIHTLFDLGLLAINPETMTVAVHESLWESEPYASLDGVKITLPDGKLVWPDKAALAERWEAFQDVNAE